MDFTPFRFNGNMATSVTDKISTEVEGGGGGRGLFGGITMGWSESRPGNWESGK